MQELFASTFDVAATDLDERFAEVARQVASWAWRGDDDAPDVLSEQEGTATGNRGYRMGWQLLQVPSPQEVSRTRRRQLSWRSGRPGSTPRSSSSAWARSQALVGEAANTWMKPCSPTANSYQRFVVFGASGVKTTRASARSRASRPSLCSR